MMRRAPWGISIIALAVFGSSHAQAPTAQAQQPPAQSMPAQPAQPQSVAVPPAPAQAGYSAATLYNYANAFARAGKPGFAVLNYERARLLDPSDPDIDANLDRKSVV